MNYSRKIPATQDKKAKMGKLPAFQFYPADWRKDTGVQSLSFHDRGVWFEILCLMHESEQRGKLLLNGKAMPEEALARLLGLDKQVLSKTVKMLVDYGIASVCPETGALVSRRMVRDDALLSIRRRCGKLGGNPSLLNQNPTTPVNQNITTRVNQSPTPSSSSSSSSSIKEAAPLTPQVLPPLNQQSILNAIGRSTDYLSAEEAAIAGELVAEGCLIGDFEAAFQATVQRGKPKSSLKYLRNMVRDARAARLNPKPTPKPKGAAHDLAGKQYGESKLPPGWLDEDDSKS